VKEGILSRKLIFIICSMFLLGCSNNGLESTVSIDQANSVSESEIAISSNVTDENIANENVNTDADFNKVIDEQFVNTEEWISYREEQDEDIDETTLSRDELFMAFCKGEINAYEILEDGSFGNININNYQLAESISDNEIIDMTVYLKNSEPIDLDNDGECEYLLYNPVYGYMCFDCKDGKVICFAHGEGTTAVCSYTWYNGEYWIVHGDTTHAGRCMYKLSKYNGNLDIVSSFEIGWTDWDGDGNASYYMDDMELTKEQYENYINEIF